MTTEERDIRLTAYALNDPSLTSSVRDKIEATLASDAGTRQAVEETRQLAQVLTEGLAAEQNALPMAKPVTIPATRPVPATRRWAKYVVAATVVVAVCGAGFVGWSKWQDEHEKKLAMDFKRGIDLASPNEVVIFENGYRPAFGQSPNVMRAPSLNPLTGVRAVSDDSTSAIREEGALKDGAEGDKPVDALTMPGKRGAGVTAMPIAPGQQDRACLAGPKVR